MRLSFFLVLAIGVFSAKSVLADSKIFELTFDTKIGVAAFEDATKEDYDTVLIFGVGGDTAIALTASNFLRLSVYYLRPLATTENGTEQVRVKRSIQIVNPLIQYEYRFRKVGLIVGIGPSIGVVTTTFSLYDLGMPVTVAPGNNQFYFPDKKRILQSKERGIELGVILSTGFILDVGEIWGIESDFFNLSFIAEYVRRGRRNEVFGWGSILIRPTRL